MIKILKCDLTRIFSNWAFAAAIIVTAVLCFSVPVYSDDLNGKSYSVIEALVSFNRNIIAGRSEFFSPPDKNGKTEKITVYSDVKRV